MKNGLKNIKQNTQRNKALNHKLTVFSLYFVLIHTITI